MRPESIAAAMKPASPRVSIVVPVRNGAEHLRPTLDSLLAQTFADFELLIADNASVDATESICRQYAAEDPRVQYYRSAHDLGLARNFNRLVDSASGDYFKWAAADDLCRPDYLARCVDILDGDPSVVLVSAKTRFIDPADRPLDIADPGWDLRSDVAVERLRYVITSGHWVNSIYGVIRARALRRTRLLPGYGGGDYRLLGELSLLGKFCEIPEPLFLRRIHPAASSQHAGNDQWMMAYWAGGGKLSLPRWSLSRDHFVTIARSDLGVRSKVSLGLEVLRTMRWAWPRLLRELRLASKWYLRRRTL